MIGIKARIIVAYVKITLFFVKKKNKKLTQTLLDNKLNDHVIQQVVILSVSLRSAYFAEIEIFFY